MLLEQLRTIGLLDLQHQIRAECKPFLAQTKLPLYRGMSNVPLPEDAEQAKSWPISKLMPHKMQRKDRAPKDTDKTLSKIFDEAIATVAGFKPRSEGTFAVGREDVANLYGDAFLIFPKGEFKFVWSPLVEDLSMEIEEKFLFSSNVLVSLQKHASKMKTAGILSKEQAAKLKGLDTAVKQQKFWRQEFAGGDFTKLFPVISWWLPLQYKTTDLNKAIKSDHEVTIYAPEGYYVVGVDTLNLLSNSGEYSPEKFMQTLGR